MKKAIIKIEVEDDFNTGDCHNCGYKAYDEGDYGYCVLGEKWEDCPIIIIEGD